MDFDLEKFKEMLEDEFVIEIHFTYENDSFLFESELFFIIFEISRYQFMIKNMEIYDEGASIARTLIEIIKNYVFSLGFDLIKADSVLDGKFSFWEHLGFECYGIHCYLNLNF